MAQHSVLIGDRYSMGRLLGSGGFGAVYLATDERLHRPVAIKVCSTRRLPAHEAAEAARLFQSEALTLARLRHPGLTAIWDYFAHDDDWYLVMEYVPGETLRSLLKSQAGPLPQADAIGYARQLCQVLGYLHRQQPPVVFRDLKPGNIMVTPEGQIKLIDFGIARLFSPDKAVDTAQFGTPGYAPPEQYGGQTEPRSDVYSLGVLLHQMLTGHNPTSTPFALPPVRSLNPAIPDGIDSLVARATAYEIDDRVPSADEFCRLLDAALARRAPVYNSQAYTAPIVTPRPAPTASSQTQSGTTSRQLWSPTPRALPSRPAQSGWGRSLMMIVLLVLLLGGLGVGAYLLRGLIEPLVSGKAIVASRPVQAIEQPTLTVFSVTASNGSENLYQMNLGSGKIQPLVEFPPTIGGSQPAISPDGQRVAFNRETRVYNQERSRWDIAASEVWLINTDGSQPRRLLGDYSFSRAPAWSPDGQWLAVEVAKTAWRDHDVVLVNVNTGLVRLLLTTTLWEGGPSWSPDGSRLVYQTRPQGLLCMQLFSIDIQSGTPAQLTDLRGEDCSPGGSGAYWPDWSPDGSQIAFGRKLGGREQIALLDPVSREVRILDTGALPAGYPRWSSDGRYLLFEQGKGEGVRLARLDLQSCRTGCEVLTINTTYPGSHLADWH